MTRFIEGGTNRDSGEEIPIEPQKMSSDEARGPWIEVESSPEKKAEENAEKAIGAVGTKDRVDPIISSTPVKNCKEWFISKKETFSSFWSEQEGKSQKWQLENPKKAATIDYSIASARVGFVLAFKIAWGLIKFSYEAIKNKGKVPKAYEMGQEMFSFDEKGGKK